MSIQLFVGAASILGVLAVVIFFRLIAGPTNADRAVALDTLNTLAIAAMIILAVIKDSVVMVDVAIVYAALSFVGTMFIARHIEGGM
ncbi:MAG TPA: monovalent cation/H+ antiporter complex subunit F [Synergistales bacterium]|nr:monovalent cation/H+ antiporter complex subunit F [Synergistales bacterium]